MHHRVAAKVSVGVFDTLPIWLISHRINIVLSRASYQGLGGDVAIKTTRVSVPVFSMPCSHHGGK